MVLMKAVQKKRSGNSAPHKRTPFPEVSQDALDKAMHSWRANALKRPAAESIMKKPSSSSSKSQEVKAKPPLGPGKGRESAH